MNYINIDSELKKKIVEKIEKDTEYLYQRYKEKKIKEYEFSHVMIYIAGIRNTSVGYRYQKELEDILGFILRFYREELYEGRYDCFFLRGMYSGIGNIVYALECCIKQGIDVMQFYRYLLKLLMKFTEEYLNQIDIKKVRMNNYDILYGISGLTYHLLDVTESNSDLICKALRYLVSLTDEKEYRGRCVINFHIEPEQQNSAHETSEFPKGHIDFGMAHGMIGVLVTLAKAKFLGYDFPELTNAIHKLVEIYDKFSLRDNGVLKFPTKIGIDEWEKGKAKEYSFNAGWCYGNTGILRGLMKTMKYLEDDVKYSFYQKELLCIINLPISEYKFTTPVLCHGYASILAMQLNAYAECADIHFLDVINRNINVLLIENERYLKTKEGKDYFQSNDLLVGWNGVDVILNQIIKNTVINT